MAKEIVINLPATAQLLDLDRYLKMRFPGRVYGVSSLVTDSESQFKVYAADDLTQNENDALEAAIAQYNPFVSGFKYRPDKKPTERKVEWPIRITPEPPQI